MVSGDRFTVILRCRFFCQNVWSFKTGGLSWQWSLKTGFTVYYKHFLNSAIYDIHTKAKFPNFSPILKYVILSISVCRVLDGASGWYCRCVRGRSHTRHQSLHNFSLWNIEKWPRHSVRQLQQLPDPGVHLGYLRQRQRVSGRVDHW